MFADISEIAFAVSDYLATSARRNSPEPGCYGRTFRGSSRHQGGSNEIRRSYWDERDLAQQIEHLDEEFDPSQLTVVVVLDERTRQVFTAATIRRSEPALRLAITTTFGAGPAHDFVGDLSARSLSLGWRQIVCDRNCDRAIRESLNSTRQGENCVVFRPQ